MPAVTFSVTHDRIVRAAARPAADPDAYSPTFADAIEIGIAEQLLGNGDGDEQGDCSPTVMVCDSDPDVDTATSLGSDALRSARRAVPQNEIALLADTFGASRHPHR